MSTKQIGPYSSPGCFIATAVYGSSCDKLHVLREFRDDFLKKDPTHLGDRLVKLYYRISPPMANFIRNNKLLKLIVRYLIVEPGYYLAGVLLFIKKIFT